MPVDPDELAITIVVMIGVSVLASYIPTLRATRVDPIAALRAE